MSRRAARSATVRPVAVEPVKQTKSAQSTTAVPTTEPGPATTCHRSSGRPASAIRARVHNRVSGVWESAFETTALPASRAGSTSPAPR